MKVEIDKGLSSYGSNGLLFNLTSGALCTLNDSLEVGPGGKVYPIQCTDYAAVGNMGSTAIAATTVFSGTDLEYHRKAAAVSSSTGYIYVTAPNSTNNGLTIYQYNPSGSLMGSVNVWTVAAVAIDPSINVLANGNVAVAFSDGTSLLYAVYDTYLNLIKTLTTVEAIYGGKELIALALSVGGFMLVWHSGVTNTVSKLAVYDNSGAVVTAAATVATWTGTVGNVQQKAVQLDNGNVAIAFNTAFTTTVGTYIAIVTAAGTSVLAATSTGNNGVINGGQSAPEIAAGVGYFAIATWNTGATKAVAQVYSNAGVLQGSAFQDANGAGLGFRVGKVMWDGSNFWYANQNVTDSTKINLTKLPISGAGYVTYGVGTIGSAGYDIDGFAERNRIVLVYTADGATGTQKFCVFNTDTLLQEAVNQITGVATAGTGIPRVVATGDFTFLLAYETATTTSFLVMKYANSAIVGVCGATTAKNALCPILSLAGAYSINAVAGSASKKFDFTSTNIYGNKGAILTNGIVLKGFQ